MRQTRTSEQRPETVNGRPPDPGFAPLTDATDGYLPQQAVADRLRSVGIAFAVLLVAVGVQTLAHLANALLFDSQFEPLDAGVEGNIFTWASSVAIFGAALIASVHALVSRERRGSFLLLAGIFAFFSMDEVVQVHEVIGWDFATGLGLPEYLGGRLFVILYAPVFAVTLVLLWRTARASAGWPHKAIMLGLILLITAIAAEGLGEVLQFATDGSFASSRAHELEIAIEEGAELGGWIMIATGLAVAFTLRLGAFCLGAFRPKSREFFSTRVELTG